MDGLCNLPYQVGIDLEVKSDPERPTVSHIPMYFNELIQCESIFSSRDMRACKINAIIDNYCSDFPLFSFLFLIILCFSHLSLIENAFFSRYQCRCLVFLMQIQSTFSTYHPNICYSVFDFVPFWMEIN